MIEIGANLTELLKGVLAERGYFCFFGSLLAEVAHDNP